MAHHCLARIAPLHRTTGDRPQIHVSSANLREITGLDGKVWEPAMVSAPSLSIRLFNGDFQAAVEPGTASLPIHIGALKATYPTVDECAWAGAEVEIWAGVAGEAWPWQQIFRGQVKGFDRKIQVLNLTAETAFDDKDVLTANYAGTSGAEGDTDLANKLKPLVLGWAKNVEPLLINAVDSVYQFSAYGPIEAVVTLFERGSDFGAAVADYASYALLVAASIAPGRWGTCLAEGLIRLGAPAFGVITGDIKGHTIAGATPRLSGAMITALAGLAGIDTARIETLTLDAMDVAAPYPISIVLTDQTKFTEAARAIALPCNHQAGISLLGNFFVLAISLSGTPSLTLDAQGQALPQIVESTEQEVSVPYTKTIMGADRAWRVHSADEVATDLRYEDGATRNLPAQALKDADFGASYWSFSGDASAEGTELSPNRKGAAIGITAGLASFVSYGGTLGERAPVQAGKTIYVRLFADPAGSISVPVLEDGVPVLEGGIPVVDSAAVIPADWPMSVDVEWFTAAGAAIARANLSALSAAGGAQAMLQAVVPPVGAAQAILHIGHGAEVTGTGTWVVWSPWLDEHQPAADVTSTAQVTIELSANKTVAADASGAVTSNNLAALIWSPTVLRGGSSIKLTDSTTYALSSAYGGSFAVSNANGATDKGNVTISAITALVAGCDLTVTVDGVAQPKIAIKVTKDMAGVASSAPGSTVSWAAGDFVGIDTTTYTSVVTAIRTVVVATGQTLYGTAPLDYYVYGVTGESRTMTFKWQYSVAGAGIYSDFAAGIAGTVATAAVINGHPYYEYYEPSPGSVAVTQSKSGLSAGNYDVRLVAIDDFTGLTVAPTGTATIEART